MTDLMHVISSCAMNVASIVPTSLRRPVQSFILHNMTPLPCSCTRKLRNFVPIIVAPSPVTARPRPEFLFCRKSRLSNMYLSCSWSRTFPNIFLRSGVLYLPCIRKFLVFTDHPAKTKTYLKHTQPTWSHFFGSYRLRVGTRGDWFS